MSERQQFEELMAGYLEGDLSAAERAGLENLIQKHSGLGKELIEDIELNELLSIAMTEEEQDTSSEFIRTILDTWKREDRRAASSSRFLRQIRKLQGIQKKQHRSSFPRIIWISFAACLIIMAGAYFYNIYQMQQIPGLIQARIMERQGKVDIIRQGDDTGIPAEKDMYIHAGDRLELERSGECIFEYIDDSSRVRAGSGKRDTHLTLNDKEKGKRMHLEAGDLHIKAAKQPDEKPMLLTTPHARAQVLGTEFTLRVIGSLNSQINNPESNRKSAIANPGLQYTRLDVDKGLVRFTRLLDDEYIDVSGGTLAVAGESLALKSYPAGTEYVHGPVLFEDDFENGLDKWKCWIKAKERKTREPYVAGPDKLIRIETAKRAGKKDHILCLARSNLRAGRILQVISKGFLRITQAVSFEYDMFFRVPHKNMFARDKRFRSVAYRPDRWYNVRNEYIPFSGNNGSDKWQERIFINGRFRGSLDVNFVPACGWHNFPHGDVFFDNAVIRTLIKLDK